MPKWQSFDDFLTAVAFPPEDASAVVTSAGDCFKAARSIAADLLRRGETLAAERKSGASAAPAAESKARVPLTGDAIAVAPPPSAAASTGSCSMIALTEAWDAAKAELSALAKVSVSNAVTSLQVAKRVNAAGATSGKGGGKRTSASKALVRGRAKVEFGAHSQFPIITVAFE
ncbi:unnamed protein product [Sphacelaria rigidula]